MLDTFADYFASSGFMPHGHCFLWTPSLLWLYVLSDSIIAASYFSIPFALWFIVQKRRDLPFPSAFLLFGAFVLACGSTHAIEVWNIWHAHYWADAAAKALTAITSATTAILLWPLIPKVLTIPSHVQLQDANRELQSEVKRRERAEAEMRLAYSALERRVAERTAELEMAYKSMRESETRYRAVAQSAKDAIVTVNDKGDIVGWNNGAAVMFGYAEAEVKHKPVTLLMQPAYRDRCLEGINRVMSGGEPRLIGKTVELNGLRKNRSEFALELSLAKWETAEGQFVTGIIRDITERKRSEETARTNEDRLRIALSNINMAMFHQDRALRYTWIYQPQLGYSAEQVIGHTDAELLPAEAARRLTELKQRVLEAGETVHEEVAVALKDATFSYDFTAEPLRDAGGRVIGLTGVMLDITERKRADEARQESEERLRAIFEGALDGIVAAEPGTGRFMTANPAMCGMLGYPLEELTRIGVSDIHPKQDLPRVREQFDKMLRADIELAEDIPVLRKDGSIFYADIKGALIRFGGRDSVLGVFRDITERKRAEEELLAAKEQFRGLVEQSIAGIYIIQDGKFAYVNPRFAEIRGYGSADELIGRDDLSVVAEKDRDIVAENIRRLSAGEARSVNYGITALRKDGSTVEVGVHGARATYKGRPAVIGLMQDISEKKRAEEQIREYIAQLETAFMSTVEVATTMSEMRDPYTAGHERRVAEIAVAIGAEIGFDARRQEGLRVAGYLHDIGKITIPSDILSKPGKLTAIEFALIQCHPRASYDVLKPVKFPWPVAEVALQHHERIDGSGYPQGLKGEAILLEARIVAVGDVIEAMSSHRPYRPGLGIDRALAEIARGRGSAYDPEVADACLRLFREGRYQLPT